jgi:hypothetical protein
MSHRAQYLVDAINNALAAITPMGTRAPDTKIGAAAAETFNTILRGAKATVPEAILVKEMTELADHDTLIGLVMRFQVVLGDLIGVINAEYQARPRSKPPYGD